FNSPRMSMGVSLIKAVVGEPQSQILKPALEHNKWRDAPWQSRPHLYRVFVRLIIEPSPTPADVDYVYGSLQRQSHAGSQARPAATWSLRTAPHAHQQGGGWVTSA